MPTRVTGHAPPREVSDPRKRVSGVHRLFPHLTLHCRALRFRIRNPLSRSARRRQRHQLQIRQSMRISRLRPREHVPKPRRLLERRSGVRPAPPPPRLMTPICVSPQTATEGMGQTLTLSRLKCSTQMAAGGVVKLPKSHTRRGTTRPNAVAPPPAYSRELCMEFAIGSVAKVLGPGIRRSRYLPGPRAPARRAAHARGPHPSLGHRGEGLADARHRRDRARCKIGRLVSRRAREHG